MGIAVEPILAISRDRGDLVYIIGVIGVYEKESSSQSHSLHRLFTLFPTFSWRNALQTSFPCYHRRVREYRSIQEH